MIERNARVLASEAFDAFAKSVRLGDQVLVDAVEAIESGLVSADLGGNVLKQRIARAGAGKSGGYRTVVVFKRGDRAVFVVGYAKNVKTDLTQKEVRALKELAKDLLALTDDELAKAISSKKLRELERHG